MRINYQEAVCDDCGKVALKDTEGMDNYLISLGWMIGCFGDHCEDCHAGDEISQGEEVT